MVLYVEDEAQYRHNCDSDERHNQWNQREQNLGEFIPSSHRLSSCPPLLHAPGVALAVFSRMRGAPRSAMLTSVFAPIKKLQVLGAVIHSVAVDVMDGFIASKTTAYHIFHDEAVLANIAVVSRVDEDISISDVATRATLHANVVVPCQEPMSSKACDRWLSRLATSAFAKLRTYVGVASKRLLAACSTVGRTPRVMALSVLPSRNHSLATSAFATHRLSITGLGGDYNRQV